MPTWKVIYQDVPFNYTQPHVLIVPGAPTKAAAFAIAYDTLTRMGLAVGGISMVNPSEGLTKEEREEARGYGVPAELFGHTRIRSIQQHNINIPGGLNEG